MSPGARPITVVAVVIAAATVACPARRQGPETPKLEASVDRVDRRLERLRGIREVMQRDLERVETLSGELAGTSTDLFGGEFPLDLFKHVAVSCLNASSIEPDDDSEATADPSPSSDAPLQCRPRFSDRLVDRIDERTPDRRDRAMRLLARVDEFHTLRSRLWTRLRKIGDILEETREFVASQRAALRKRRTRWERRRQELSPERWHQLSRRFSAYAARLEELEEASDQLAEAVDSWPKHLDRANREMYLAITSQWKRPK